ncbi:hypothetical protein HDU80_000911, partial [Chytriomyces hyalinus]
YICGKATSDNVFYCSHDCQVADAAAAAAAFATSTAPSPTLAQTHFVNNNAIQSINHYHYQDGLGNYTLAASSKRSAIIAPYHSIGGIIKQGMDTCAHVRF